MLAKKTLNSQRTAIDVWGFRRCDALPSCLALREPMQSGKRSFRCLFAARFPLLILTDAIRKVLYRYIQSFHMHTKQQTRN